MNKLLPYLVVSLFFLSLIPIGSSTVTVYTGQYFYVGNETYGVTQTMNFSYIQHNSAWIKFNTTDFNVTSANSIDINLSFLHENISTATASDKVLDFVVNCSSGVVGFSIGGFKSSNQYVVKRNATQIATPTSNGAGYIYFTNNVWSHKHFEIYDDASGFPPNITINFAGNLSDSGGPYYRPPYEVTQLTGVHSDGYYTNDSRQHEGWIYINCSVEDDGAVSDVWLQWLNETTWTNYSYAFTERNSDYWDINTSSNFSTNSGYNYSFNVVANDSTGSQSMVEWNKTTMGINPIIPNPPVPVYSRRYVQLNCTPVNISSIPFYFFETPSTDETNYNRYDRLDHDQGTGGIDDTGYLNSAIPSDNIENRSCGGWVAYWFNDDTCVVPFELDNIYFHFWYNHTSTPKAGFWRTDGRNTVTGLKSYDIDDTDYRSSVNVDSGGSKCFYLETNLYDGFATDNFTDNSIYELLLIYKAIDSYCVSNRSFTSFVLFNVPCNTTLQGWDNDSDGLTNYEELYVTYTNPWLEDTDNDGFDDYQEFVSGSDPNNYSESFGIGAPVLSNPVPTNGSSEAPTQLNITINDPSGQTFNWTIDTSPDVGNSSAFGESNGTKTCSITGMVYGTVYTWWVNCTNIYYWSNATYSFTYELEVDPPYNGSSIYNTTVNDLNLTWTRGNYSDQEVVVKNTDHVPTSPTDGTVMQNNTNTSYNESISSFAYYTIWSYNTTSNAYSSTGLNIPWGVLGLNCFNESDPSQAIGFDIEISNSDASITYTASDLTNTHYIDLNDIPYGDDTIFVISNSSYRQRIFYFDITLNSFLNYSFYLPPIETPVDPGSGDDGGNTTATQLYLLTVVGPQNEYTSPPVEGAKITIKRYNNMTDTYTNITSVLTDANGERDVYLIPLTLYKVVITKDGYDTSTSDYIPSNSIFTKTFRITPTVTPPPEYDIFWDDVTFTGDMFVNGTIKVTYSDSNSSTVNTSIYLYDVFADPDTLNDTHNNTGSSSFVYWVSSINTSRDYELWLYFNNTADYASVTSPVVVTVFAITWDGPITPDVIEERFESMFGEFELGYFNVIAIIIPIILLCTFGMLNAGLGILTAGVSLGFFQAFFGLNASASFNPLLALACPIVIAIGFLYMITVKPEENI